MYPADAEFGFELLVCRWAEESWPPDGERDSAVLVARQLGTKRRRWDTVVVECDPAGLAARAQFGDRTLDSDLLHVVRNAPAEWEWYRDALPHPGYPWRYVRAAVHRAAGRGVVEKRRRGNRIEIRRVAPYPDWVRRIVAVENKPDLDASAARALSDQLERDVETGLADEVWVATAATGRRVEPALLEDVPVEVGILTVSFDPDRTDWATAAVEWHPSDVTPEDAEDDIERATTRLELAERAYGKGWRSFHETMRPDCRHFELRRFGDAFVPHCAAKGRSQTAAECAGSCPDFEPEPPAWRTKGWPIAGGPGKAIRRLLDDRRERVRQRETERAD
ncbi:DUF5787 family protein [Halopelagius longus]|uniref:Uncharacterized protein n=1 Tax=Halopelagius longus TaxID=1236180 RepID=A0A1H1AZI5_9EURY|nr:DUF5787 family protein [Halopelagius longus]RDI70579.1 hypothetical protein DWB78_01925 [Halopelagius longus]SDQ45084.1 hypothetical protein SAMN05216278_1564 [Halopelagius longus]